MHSCPECGQACYCDVEDCEIDLSEDEECFHECDLETDDEEYIGPC